MLVLLPPHGGVAHLPDLPREARRLERELPQRLVLDAVLAVHLLHEQLGVGHDLDLSDLQLGRPFEAGDEGPVLRHVVRRDADRLAVGGEHRPVLRLEHVAERGRAGIAARAAVGVEARLHDGDEVVDVEGRLLVRVRARERRHDLVLKLGRKNRLEPELGDPLLAARPPHARRRPLAAEERARALRVPGAALVVADPPGPGLEERVAHVVERLPRDEHDELAVHANTASIA